MGQPTESSPVADAQAAELLAKAEALRVDAINRKVGRSTAAQWVAAMGDLQRPFERIQERWIIRPEATVIEFYRLGYDFGTMPAADL